ncbi:MAG: UDP-N-acetylmuramoylalanine--D-glutamate ligase, partial [Rickettsiales bacterium]
MKKFLIYGLGISGMAAIDFLLKKNLPILVGDDNPESPEKLPKNPNLKIAKKIEEINWQEIDCLILAAGIALTHKIAISAKNNNCPIICDVEILHRFSPEAKFIGITGTNGKSTTTALTGHIFDEDKKPHATGGNIGFAALALSKLKKDENYIIEASSYQLDLIDKTKFHITNLLNITPDHLDRHGNMENYVAAKKNIFKNQAEDDFALIGIDNKNS